MGLALLGGMLLGLSFPEPGLAPLAWIVPGWVLWLGGRDGGRNTFRTGFYVGLGFHLTSLHWLLYIPIPLNAILGWLALSSFLSLLVGGWSWISWRLRIGLTLQQPNDRPAQHTDLSRRHRFLWYALTAASWVTMEMIVARIFGGFPWNLLGASQYEFLPLIQVSALTGVYGVSFVVAWASVTLVFTGMLLWNKRLTGKSSIFEAAPVIAVLLALLVFGFAKMRAQSAPEKSLNIALIQPSFPQPLIWDAKEKTNRFNGLLELSRRALASKPDVLVWPETSLPDFFTRHNAVAIQEITSMAKEHNVWIVYGANDTRAREINGVRQVDLFNSAFLVNPKGQLANRYHKRRLVMFGEYMPMRDWFPFLKQFRGSGGGLTPGVQDVPFELGAQLAKAGILICFEDVFPHFARRSVAADTDFLLNLTNDGWFGQGSAQWQHAAAAAFRAVENGVPLVRCTNNGLTCWVDAQGRMHEVYFEGSKDVHAAGFKIARIPLKAEHSRTLTFYTKHGDLFGWTCVAFTGVMMALFGVRKKGGAAGSRFGTKIPDTHQVP